MRAAIFLTLLSMLAGSVAGARTTVPTQLSARPLRGLRAEVATLIIGSGDGGPLAMTALALPVEASWNSETESASVPLLFELEGAALLEGVGETVDSLTVEFYVYALQESAAVQSYLGCKVEVSLEQEGEALYAGGIKLLADLQVPAGEYLLRFLAREPVSGRYALRSQPLLVADPGERRPEMSAPLVGEPSGGWLLAQPSAGRSAAASAVEFPLLERDGEELLPTGLALLPIGGSTVVAVDAVGLPADSALTASLASHTDDSRRSLQVRLLSRTALEGGAAERLLVELALPNDVPVGTYRLELAAAGDEGPFRTGLETVAVPPLDQELVWGQLRSYLARDVLERRTEVTLPRGRRRDRREIDPEVREAYQAVLARLVSSRQIDEAAAELVRGETEIFLADAAEGLDRLRNTEIAIARLLGTEQREALLPLVLVHLEAYRLHRAGRSFALATHARLTAEEMIDLYASGGEGSEAPGLASLALTCLAADLTQSRLWKQSDFLLSKAIDLDGGNSQALLMLASSQERFGDYSSAVELGQRAVEADPRADEARLRLAVNLVRVGHQDQAERMLRRLLEVRAEDWLQVLAYEELTRLLMRQSRLDEAARTIRSGVSRFPDQQGLYVVLAYVLERLGRPEEGAGVLQRLPAASVEKASPRFRYSQPRPEALEEARRRLMRNAEVRLSMLAAALSESEG